MSLLLKTFASLSNDRLVKLAIASMLGSAVLMTVFLISVSSAVAYFLNFGEQNFWLYAALVSLATAGSGLVGWFMLPVVVVLIGGLMLENVVQAVEEKEYPDRIGGNNIGFWRNMIYDLKFVGLVIILNLVVLPFYLFGIGFLASIILNSYLLGREFFESVAACHMPKADARRLIESHKFEVYGAGAVITIMTLVPFINLFMPIFGAVLMVHIFHSILTKNNSHELTA